MYSSVQIRVVLLGVKGGLTPVDMGLPINTSCGLSPVVAFGGLLMEYNTKGNASGHFKPVAIIVFVSLSLMVEFILST